MIEIKSPAGDPTASRPWYSIFLAGSIEQDKAERWQDDFINKFVHDPVVIYNPRRENWDPTLTNEITEPVFEAQVMWELKHMDLADAIVMYFDPKTKSPVTLLELGLHAESRKLIVCCPPGFWRKGNVDIVCREYKVEQVEDLDQLAAVVRRRMKSIDEFRASYAAFAASITPITQIMKRMKDDGKL